MNSYSRRSAIAAIWGASASAGCERWFRTPTLPGRIRGAAVGVGHLLREHATGAEWPNAESPLEFVVVGGGVSGLSAARALGKSGVKNFAVLDLEARLGGTSQWGTDGTVPYPWGAHYLPMPRENNPALVSFLADEGLIYQRKNDLSWQGREGVLVRAPQERYFANGVWRAGLLATDAEPEQARFFKLMARYSRKRGSDGRRMFTLPMALASKDPALRGIDKQTAADFLAQNGFTSDTVLSHADYACRDDYGTALGDTSAWALIFYFAARLDAEGNSAPFLTWPNGNGELVQRLARELGSRAFTGQMALSCYQDQHLVHLLSLDVKTKQLRHITARKAVLAVPKFLIPRLLKRAPQKLISAAREFSYSAWLVANIHLKRRPPMRGELLAWDSVIPGSKGLGYVDAKHQTLDDWGPTVWTYYHPLTHLQPADARRYLLSARHRELAEGVMEDLALAHPDLRSYVERLDVWRWGHAMVRPTPGFLFGGARAMFEKPYGRIAFAHSDVSGLPLFEEAFYRGMQAVEDLLG